MGNLYRIGICSIAVVALSGAVSLAATQPAESPDPANAAVEQASSLADYGDTYTPEELSALDRALWAANMTRQDMTFKKDYTEGHGCFPIVLEMMHDPLLIASWMDQTAALCLERASLVESRSHVLANLHSYSQGDDFPGHYEGGHSEMFPVDGLDDLLDGIEGRFGYGFQQAWSDEERAILREQITTAMAWHTFEQAEENAGYEAAKANTDQELYGLLDKYVQHTPQHDPWGLLTRNLSRGKVPHTAFPIDAPAVRDTPHGRICIGTMGDDYYEGDYAVLIEPGGNDTYHNCRIGAAYGKATPELGDGRIGYFVDLGGDDFYDCADVNITLGAAVLGVAAFYDLGGGDDRYYAGSCSLGAAMGGVATFYDDGGSDYYSGKVYTQGAAGFGIGIMIDDSVEPAPEFDTAEGNDAVIDSYETGESDVDTYSLMDNDYYTAWSNAQAFARPRGVALCINRRGNETYHAGGVYLHAPLFADRYQSFSQGFAIGERGIDWAGGIAMLIDYGGNDKYLGDVYNQGVGYWYGAGLLWDGGGNDTYEMTQYGQGSGIHLAVGGLVDVDGHDSYIMHSGLGQGGSHDLAASILHDRGGNDRYHGSTSCNGAALTGSVGIHLDRSGNDTYAGRRDSINVGDNRRINIGLLCDLDGTDDYMLPIMVDGAQWTHTNIGMGLDIMPPPPPEEVEEEAAEPEEPEVPPVPIPEICYYEGELTQEVFDELWEISIRWAVGDNRWIVPEARRRLIEFGPEVLPYISAVMDKSNSGLAYRAYVEIFGALYEEHGEAVDAVLRENAASGEAEREKAALYLTGELKLTSLEDMVVGFLEHEDPAKVRRAIGVLGSLESHAADENLIDLLDPSRNDEPLIKAALTTLTDLKVRCYPALHPLMEHPLLSVRELLVKQLVKHWDVYSSELLLVAQLRADDDSVWFASAEGRIDIELLTTTGYVVEQQEVLGETVEFEEPMWAAVPLGIRGIRSLLHILAQVDVPILQTFEQVAEADYSGPDVTASQERFGGYLAPGDGEPFDLVGRGLLNHEDWGVRADAVRVVRHWQELAEDDDDLGEMIAPVVAAMEEMLADETDAYVLFAAGM